MTLGTATRNAPESMAGAKIFVDQISLPGDDSYVTGGTLDFDGYMQFLLGDSRDVIGVISGDCGNNEAIYIPNAGATPGKLQVRVRSTGLEVANAVDLSATTFNLTVLSK